MMISTAYADVDDKILIRGKIGSQFDDQKVKVTDSLGQTYYLPRKVFPPTVQIKQGQEFNIEVEEKEMEGIKPLKKI